MAMLVMSLLGLAVVGTISSVARSSLAANNRLQATNTVQTIADRLSKSLRSAHPMNTTPTSAFDVADARHVLFYTDAGTRPVRGASTCRYPGQVPRRR